MSKVIKKIIKRIPIVGHRIYKKLYPPKPFTGSEKYWIDRYKEGGNSGRGSYSKLADFKADVINQFVSNNSIQSVIELGCGDGNQLKLSNYPSYIGFDVSPKAISQCKSIFSSDLTKQFYLIDDYSDQVADLTMSLDVIYHLVEDDIFDSHMTLLFDASSRFSIIYSSNKNDDASVGAAHVRHRKFTNWIEKNRPEWKMLKHIPNKYPWKGTSRTGSFADFYIFQKSN